MVRVKQCKAQPLTVLGTTVNSWQSHFPDSGITRMRLKKRGENKIEILGKRVFLHTMPSGKAGRWKNAQNGQGYEEFPVIVVNNP